LSKVKEYFTISIEELQNIASWAASCADRVLPLYEIEEKDDLRPRNAILGTKEFAITGKRTNLLRKQAMDAYRASNETNEAKASATARAASLAAASAYTHPLKDKNQAKHILGPAVYAALALEIENNNEERIGDKELEIAIRTANECVKRIILQMPKQEIGDKRIDRLYYKLDNGIRNK
jgi:hypothetical protein